MMELLGSPVLTNILLVVVILFVGLGNGVRNMQAGYLSFMDENLRQVAKHGEFSWGLLAEIKQASFEKLGWNEPDLNL